MDSRGGVASAMMTGVCVQILKQTNQNAGEAFFAMRVARNWNRLPRGAGNAPFLEVFKLRLDQGFELADLVKDVAAHSSG